MIFIPLKIEFHNCSNRLRKTQTCQNLWYQFRRKNKDTTDHTTEIRLCLIGSALCIMFQNGSKISKTLKNQKKEKKDVDIMEDTEEEDITVDTVVKENTDATKAEVAVDITEEDTTDTIKDASYS